MYDAENEERKMAETAERVAKALPEAGWMPGVMQSTEEPIQAAEESKLNANEKKQRWRRAARLLVDGHTVDDVAQQMGVSRKTVYYWMQKLGVKRQPPIEKKLLLEGKRTEFFSRGRCTPRERTDFNTGASADAIRSVWNPKTKAPSWAYLRDWIDARDAIRDDLLDCLDCLPWYRFPRRENVFYPPPASATHDEPVPVGLEREQGGETPPDVSG
jgi:transposase-like protein